MGVTGVSHHEKGREDERRLAASVWEAQSVLLLGCAFRDLRDLTRISEDDPKNTASPISTSRVVSGYIPYEEGVLGNMATQLNSYMQRRLQDLEYRCEYGAESAKLDLARVLGEARRGQGMTQQELATLLNVSQAYIGKLESGEANPTLGRVGAILAAIWLKMRLQTAPLMPDAAHFARSSERASPNTVQLRKRDDSREELWHSWK